MSLGKSASRGSETLATSSPGGVAQATKPTSYQTNPKKPGTRFDTRIYQSTHTTGGAIMGTTPANSVVNRYLQSWDVHNLFVTGASAFPQNFGYNPTGLVGALSYWAAKAIRSEYLRDPRPMVDA